MTEYEKFLASRTQSESLGFAPIRLPDFLFDFQKALVDWATRKGRAAIFADCGMGKGPMQLVWADNVVRKTNKPVLIVTTLGDSAQMIDEANKFHVEAVRSKDGTFPLGSKVVVTNYERLEKFNPDRFAGVACNESSAIKDMEGKRSGQVIEFMRTIPYRLLCTATASPNDHMELGTSSEALGGLGYMDMLARFFRSDNGTLHPFRHYPRHSENKPTGLWTFRPYAEQHFWRWVCSWARACRKPSDLGFEDRDFILPEHEVNTHVVHAARIKPGFLFELPAVGLQEQNEERRRTVDDRCEAAARLLGHDRPGIAWCHLNPEGDLLAKLIPGAFQVHGRMHDDEKEEAFTAFVKGQIRVLVTKPKIAGLGLNFQHAAHQTYFPSHSFEQYYQAIRRLWRFGQKNKVVTDLVTTEGGADIMRNVQRKADQAEVQYSQIVALMGESNQVDRAKYGTKPVELPAWI